MPNYQLLVNADDFGRHVLIDQAVKRCVEEGCLRSATLMPGGKAFDDAVEVARCHPELGVGIHLTLVNGFPVCEAKDIPSLVTKEGVFLDNHVEFVKHFLKGQIAMEDVQRELMAQAAKMERAGLPLTHVDSHQHMHMLPGVIDISLDVAASLHLDAVRISRTPLFTAFAGMGQLIGRLGLFTLSELSLWKAKRRHFRVPDHFEGIVAGEAVHEGHFLHILKDLRPGTTEVMMHPGTCNEVLQEDSGWQHDFEEEMRAIVSPKVRRMIADKAVKIVNYRDLK